MRKGGYAVGVVEANVVVRVVGSRALVHCAPGMRVGVDRCCERGERQWWSVKNGEAKTDAHERLYYSVS